MPRTCCVPLCSSNSRLRGTPSVTTFAFPKNEKRRQLWLKYIPRENFVPGSSAAVCIKHFKEHFVVRQVTATRDDGSILVVHRERPKLSDDAYPSIFEDITTLPVCRRKLNECSRKNAERNKNSKRRMNKPHQITTTEEMKVENVEEEEPQSLSDVSATTDSTSENKQHHNTTTKEVKVVRVEQTEPHTNGPRRMESTSCKQEVHITVENVVSTQENGATPGCELSCQHCKDPCATESALKAHYATCHLSPSETQSSNKTPKHVNSDTSEINSRKLARVVEMYKTVVHTGQTLYSCEECPALFTSYFHLEQHKLVHPGSQPMFCSSTDESDLKLVELQSQNKKQKKEKTHMCEVCKETFQFMSELRLHKQTHGGSTLHCCDVCGKCFQRASKLKVHKRVHTNERPYNCEICHARFTQFGNLNIHKRIHSGERPFKCDICKAAFMQPTHLKVHRRSHTGERPYSCNVCDASFTQLTSLILHKRSHTGERPFPCDICNLAFNSRGDLKVHKRRHTGERPYVCDVCKASFTHQGTLNVHKRRHTGKRSFLCDACGVAFITHSELKTHKRRHTGEQPYHCDVCGAAFTQVGSLNTHKRRHQDTKIVTVYGSVL